MVDPPAGIAMKRVADLEDLHALFSRPALLEDSCGPGEIRVGQEDLHVVFYQRGECMRERDGWRTRAAAA
jgi:hypothetical protein